MELRVDTVKVPERIGFNYEELKAQLTARCHDYETIVYTDDTISEAKVDRAMLNKLKDNLNAERLRRQREYMHPFDVFKAQVDELISIINRASGSIDKQVKDYEKRQQQQKLEEIHGIFDNVFANATDAPDWITFEMVNDPKWMLKSRTIKSIQGDIESRTKSITDDVKMIRDTFKGKPFEDAAVSAAMASFKRSLDFRTAVNAGVEIMEEMAAAQNADKAEKVEAKAEAQDLPLDGVKLAEVIPDVEEAGPIHVSENAAGTEEEKPRERVQRVTVAITASESQFGAVNALFSGLRQAGAKFEVISKEELA